MFCLKVDDIVLISQDGVLHPHLAELYNAYRAQQGASAKGPVEWIRQAARGAAGAWLRKHLGAHVNEITQGASAAFVHLPAFPIPERFRSAAGGMSQHFHDVVAYITRNDTSNKLWDRLGIFNNIDSGPARLLREAREVSRGYLNILKGNIAEILSFPLQLATLAHIRGIYPDAVLITGVRIRRADSGTSRLFSDNIIGSFDRDGNLIIYHVFEVKAGLEGGVAGVDQVVRWFHRFNEGVEIHIPVDADIFRLPRSSETTFAIQRTASEHLHSVRPNASARVGDSFVYAHNLPSEGGRVRALPTATRDVVTARGESSLAIGGTSSVGLDQISQLGSGDVERLEIKGASSEEIDYVVKHLFLERRP